MGRGLKKLEKLRKIVKDFRSVAVAFSGGVDSTLVAKIAHDELKNKAIAVTVDSPMYPASELKAARKAAEDIGIKHIVVKSDPLADSRFFANPPDRCYVCKLDDMTQIKGIAAEHGLKEVADGTNADDKKDYRPGLKAKLELGVRSPLAEARIGKADARRISKALGLPTSAKRSSPCLASRIPYGETITREKLRMVEEAEEFILGKGFDDVRVRVRGNSARIEVDPSQVDRLASAGTRIAISKRLHSLGFLYVSIDMDGYRMGSLNRELEK